MVKLLVADDEQKICRLLEQFFVERGFQVTLVHDGQSALDCIKRERPHLVFLDLHMPGLDGFDVLQQAREMDDTIKIIVVTATEDEETLQKVKALGAADYVVKPFSLEYLQEEVLTKVSSSLYEDLRHTNEHLKESLEELREIARGIVSAFSLVISKIDPHYTHEHVSRSVEYATKIIKRLQEKGVSLNGMPEEVLLAGYQVRLDRVQRELRVPDGLPKVRSNQNQLQEVVLNLILNACQAMGEKGGTLLFTATPNGSFVTLVVEDTGPGIAAANLRKIFSPFFTTKTTGTGLGLFVSQRIIRSHGGTIELSSEEGKGTRFTIRLPVWKEGEQVPAADAAR